MGIVISSHSEKSLSYSFWPHKNDVGEPEISLFARASFEMTVLEYGLKVLILGFVLVAFHCRRLDKQLSNNCPNFP